MIDQGKKSLGDLLETVELQVFCLIPTKKLWVDYVQIKEAFVFNYIWVEKWLAVIMVN